MENLLNARQLADLMSLSESTVRRKAHAGEIPSIKCGRGKKAALRFDYQEVLHHLKDARELQHCSSMAE